MSLVLGDFIDAITNNEYQDLEPSKHRQLCTIAVHCKDFDYHEPTGLYLPGRFRFDFINISPMKWEIFYFSIS